MPVHHRVRPAVTVEIPDNPSHRDITGRAGGGERIADGFVCCEFGPGVDVVVGFLAEGVLGIPNAPRLWLPWSTHFSNCSMWSVSSRVSPGSRSSRLAIDLLPNCGAKSAVLISHPPDFWGRCHAIATRPEQSGRLECPSPSLIASDCCCLYQLSPRSNHYLARAMISSRGMLPSTGETAAAVPAGRTRPATPVAMAMIRIIRCRKTRVNDGPLGVVNLLVSKLV